MSFAESTLTVIVTHLANFDENGIITLVGIMHISPFISSFINTVLLTDAVGYAVDIWTLVLYIMVYAVFDYWWVKTTGDVQYDFLDWEDESSYYMVLLYLTLVVGVALIQS